MHLLGSSIWRSKLSLSRQVPESSPCHANAWHALSCTILYACARPLSKRPSNLSTQVGSSTPSSAKGLGSVGASAAPLAARRTTSGSQPRVPSRTSTLASESDANELAEQVSRFLSTEAGIPRMSSWKERAACTIYRHVNAARNSSPAQGMASTFCAAGTLYQVPVGRLLLAVIVRNDCPLSRGLHA